MITLHYTDNAGVESYSNTSNSILKCLGEAEELFSQIYDEDCILVSHPGFIEFYRQLITYGRATLFDMTNRRVFEFFITFTKQNNLEQLKS